MRSELHVKVASAVDVVVSKEEVVAAVADEKKTEEKAAV